MGAAQTKKSAPAAIAGSQSLPSHDGIDPNNNDNDVDNDIKLIDGPSQPANFASVHRSQYDTSRVTVRALPNVSPAGQPSRFYWLYEPVATATAATTSTLPSSVALPLVICLHGTDEDCWTTELAVQDDGGYSWLAEAEKNRFYVAFGQSQSYCSDSMSWRRPPDTYRSSWAPGVLDLHYVENLLADATNNYPIDTSRIYVIGFSNGGMFVPDLVTSMRPGLMNKFAGAVNYMGGISMVQLSPFLGTDIEPLQKRTTACSEAMIAKGRGNWFMDEKESATIGDVKTSVNLKQVSLPLPTPMYIITGSRDDNRPPSYRCWSLMSLLQWPVRLLDMDGIKHQYQSSSSAAIWTWFTTLPTRGSGSSTRSASVEASALAVATPIATSTVAAISSPAIATSSETTSPATTAHVAPAVAS